MSSATNAALSPGGRVSIGPSTLTTGEADWWESERLAFLDDVLWRPVGHHLDVGCGRGAAAARIARLGTFVVAVDAHRYDDWSETKDLTFVIADVEHLPFCDGAFERASALDVIEHLADDRSALLELRRITADDGDVVITVPAEPKLWSEHDVRVGHHRRYRRSTATDAMSAAGLSTTRVTYFFSWLFPIMYAFRQSRGSISGNEGGRLTTRLAHALCRAERAWLRRRALPFGTSLLVVARPDATRSPSKG